MFITMFLETLKQFFDILFCNFFCTKNNIICFTWNSQRHFSASVELGISVN